MSAETVTVDAVVDYLNELLSLDPKAISSLCLDRVACNDALRNHPTVQVVQMTPGQSCSVGLLGIINGMFGMDVRGLGPICMIWKDDQLLGFGHTAGRAVRDAEKDCSRC